MQHLAVALIVAACLAYAVWALLPAGARRGAAAFALRAHWPSFVESRLRRAASKGGGCACNGCDQGAAKPAAQAEQPIRIHRPPNR